MAEIIGIVSGVAGLVTFAAQITKLSYSLISDLKEASQVQKLYLQEVSALTDVLFQADNAAFEAAKLGLGSSRPPSLSVSLIADCTDQLSRIQDDLAAGIKRAKWLFHEKELKKRIDSLHNFHSIFHDYLSTHTLTITTATYRKISDFGRRQQRDKLLRWLMPSDETSKPAPIAAPGTGKWFTGSEQYRNWRDGEPSVLWCYGAPGSGKSVLASIIAQNLRTSQSGQPCIASYFCDYAARKQQDLRSILQSLLRELINQLEDSVILALMKFQDVAKGDPDVKMLSEMVVTICKQVPSTYLILDAPDELDGSKKTISIFQGFSAAGCRVIVTSRDTPDLRHDLLATSKIEIRAAREDMALFLQHCFRESGHHKIVLRGQDLIESVVEKANGIFLLAKILADKLLDMTTLAQMRKALKMMPTTITEAFESSVKRIEAQSPARRNLAYQVISWVTQAQRRLKANELVHALAVEEGSDEFDEDNIPDVQLTLEVCVGLVTKNDTDDSIGMVHTTAHEFFHGRCPPHIRRDIAATCLSYLTVPPFTRGPCKTLDEMRMRHQQQPFMLYASKFWGDYIDADTEDDLSDLLDTLLSSRELRLSSFQALHCRPDITDEALAAESLATIPTDQVPLHLAAYWSLGRTMKMLLDQGHDSSAKDSQQWTPLHWACSRESIASMEHLIAAGADLDAKDSQGWTPLFWLAMHGNEVGVRMILSSGAKHLIRDVHGWTALTWAVSARRQTVVRLLLEHHEAWLSSQETKTGPRVGDLTFNIAQEYSTYLEADSAVNVAADIGDTDLFNVLCSRERGDSERFWSLGHFDIPVANVWRTLSKSELINGIESYLSVTSYYLDSRDDGLEPQPPDKWKGRLLHRAIKDGKYMVTRALIDSGADVNYEIFRTPLHAAAYRKDARYVRLLLENGADPSRRDCYGQTALHQAVLNGFVDTASELLTGGSDVNARVVKQDAQKQKGRFARVRVDSESMASLTLACGMNGFESIWEGSNNSETPLSLMISLLISHNADVNLTDRQGMSPLHYAARNGYLDVVQQLINAGADVDATDLQGATPLHCGAESMDRRIVECIVGAGANILAVDSEGKHNIHYFADGQWDAPASREDLQGILSLIVSRIDPDILNIPWPFKIKDSQDGNRGMTSSSRDTKSLQPKTRNGLSLALISHKWDLLELLYQLGATFPLGFEVQSFLPNAVSAIRPQTVKILLEHGATLTGDTFQLRYFPLWYEQYSFGFCWDQAVGALDDFSTLLNTLLRAGLDINGEQDQGVSLLQHAASSVDSAELTQLLLDAGADVRKYSTGGLDPFMISAVRGHYKTLQTLLDYASKSPLKDHWTESVESISQTNDGILPMIRALKHHDLLDDRKQIQLREGTNACTLLWLSAAAGNEAMLSGLLSHNADPNTTDECGWSPIHIATYRGSEEAVRALILGGADVTATTRGWTYYHQMDRPSKCPHNWQGTSLHLAAMKGYPRIVELLISHGADVTTYVEGAISSPGHGPTALHLALDTGTFYGWRAECLGKEKMLIIEMLIDNGADVSTVVDHIRLEDVIKFEEHQDLWDKLRIGTSDRGARVSMKIGW